MKSIQYESYTLRMLRFFDCLFFRDCVKHIGGLEHFPADVLHVEQTV